MMRNLKTFSVVIVILIGIVILVMYCILLLQVTAAKDFTVAYYNNYKVVTNKKANETYVLYQCGVPKPIAGSPGVVPGAKIFEVPLMNVAVTDTIPLGFLVGKKFRSCFRFSVPGTGKTFCSLEA